MPKEDDDLDLDGVDQLDPGETNSPELEDEDVGEETDEPDNQDEDETPQDEQPDAVTAKDQRTEKVAGRAADRIRLLNERVRAAERERQEANRRLDELLQRRADQQAPTSRQVESAEQRQHRRSSMTPEDRIAEDLRESEQRMTQQMQGMQATNWDSNDRALYQSRASTDPLYRRWSDRVESEIKRLATQGTYGVAREAVLKFLLGAKVLEQRESGGNKKRQERAARRVAANTTRPGAIRSDAGSQRRERGGRSLEERLADQQL